VLISGRIELEKLRTTGTEMTWGKLFVVMVSAVSTATLWSEAREPRFQDYRVSPVFSGPTHAPDFGDRSHYEGTDIRCFGGDPEQYRDERANFAGHYVLEACTCGSSCQYYFIWDAADGKFYGKLPPGPIQLEPSPSGNRKALHYSGAQYRADSALVIESGCDEGTCNCSTRYFRWMGERFQLVLKRRSPSPCGR
jgi:hypothetical protein